MPDMGIRGNVLGPQPIAARRPIPPEVIETVARVMDLLASGSREQLAALAVERERDAIAALASALEPGKYEKREIFATARTNDHYWIKARMSGPGVKPFLFQLRIGLDSNRWAVWQAINLTGLRSAWTR